MQELEKMRQWLKTYPGWQEGWKLSADNTEGSSGSCGLFPQGMEVTARYEDVMGNITLRCRYGFYLEMMVSCDEKQEKTAQEVMDLQNWVQLQSIRRMTPAFGDVPEEETMKAEKGRLSRIRRPGIAGYQICLTAEFTKYYEVM